VTFPVTNPDKVFWPDDGYTKLDLVRYYDFIFPKLRPYVKDRSRRPSRGRRSARRSTRRSST